MKGSRISVSFQGVNWWDTLSREQQLLYIQQHATKKKVKPIEVAASVAKDILSKAAAFKSRAVKNLGALKHHFKAATDLVRAGKAEMLTEEQEKAYKKVYLNTGVKMLLLFAAAVALGPVLMYAPLLASAYINWKLDLGKGKPSRDDADPEDEQLLDDQTKAALAAHQKKQASTQIGSNPTTPIPVPNQTSAQPQTNTGTTAPTSTPAPTPAAPVPAAAPTPSAPTPSAQAPDPQAPTSDEDDPELKDYFDFLRNHAEKMAIEEQKATENPIPKKKNKKKQAVEPT